LLLLLLLLLPPLLLLLGHAPCDVRPCTASRIADLHLLMSPRAVGRSV
jgi:hypothetical protein